MTFRFCCYCVIWCSYSYYVWAYFIELIKYRFFSSTKSRSLHAVNTANFYYTYHLDDRQLNKRERVLIHIDIYVFTTRRILDLFWHLSAFVYLWSKASPLYDFIRIPNERTDKTKQIKYTMSNIDMFVVISSTL